MTSWANHDRKMELLETIRREDYAARRCKPCSAEFHQHRKAMKAAEKELRKIEKEESFIW